VRQVPGRGRLIIVRGLTRNGQGRTVGVAGVLVGFQILAVMALPVALCCCVDMAIETASPAASTHEGHGTDSDSPPCPHHAHTPAEGSDEMEPGCSRLVQLVLVLSGLIGVPHSPYPALTSLSPAGALSLSDQILPEFFPLVESPPPRA